MAAPHEQDFSSQNTQHSFIKPYRVSAYECDSECRLKTGTLLNWLQDSMDQYSQQLQISRDFFSKNHLSFILRGYDIAINRLPQWGSAVFMKTMVANTSSTSFFLRQNLYDVPLKQILLSACSQVVLIDTERFFPVRIHRYLPASVCEATSDLPTALPSLNPLPQYAHEYTQPVNYDHIDFNQHVNNANYVTFAERGLSPILLRKIQLKRIAIAYKQAAKLGDTLKVQTALTPNGSAHQISSATKPNTVFARVQFTWDKSMAVTRGQARE